MEEKPKNCTCEFPEIVVRNMCGHSTNCPCYTEWKLKFFSKIVADLTNDASKTPKYISSDSVE